MAHLYSVWAYAYYGERWSVIEESWSAVRSTWQDFRSRAGSSQATAERLWANAYVAGAIALARLADYLGETAIREEASQDAEALALRDPRAIHKRTLIACRSRFSRMWSSLTVGGEKIWGDSSSPCHPITRLSPRSSTG